MKGGALLRGKLRWEVHDGKRTLFWSDVWLRPEPPIEEARGGCGREPSEEEGCGILERRDGV